METNPCTIEVIWVIWVNSASTNHNQTINLYPPSAAYMRQRGWSALIHMMDWRQAIILTNAGILLIRTLGTNMSGILS